VPVRHRGEVVGAISLSDSQRVEAMGAFASELEPLADLLAAKIAERAASLAAARALQRAGIDAPPLTRREQELLECLDEGLRFKQIARRLRITEATAKTHARHLFSKLDATSRAEAVHAARGRGLLV
jgi:DNA-binding NarL/FixJ family response regulator